MTEIKRKGHLQKQTLRLTVTSPVSIGTGASYSPCEYYYDAKSGKVYFLHLGEWFKLMDKKGKRGAYEDFLRGKYGNINTLTAWVKTVFSQGLTEVEMRPAIKSEVSVTSNLWIENNKLTLNTVRPCMHLLDGRPYIPGSSIKGLIRTAILYHLLQEDKNLKSRYKTSVSTASKANDKNSKNNVKDKFPIKKAMGKIAKPLEESLLYRLVDKKGNKLSFALADVLRGLRCSDAMPVGDVTTEILQKIDLKLRNKKGETSVALPLYRESILPGNEFTFSITLDTAMTKIIGINSVQDVLDILSEYHNFIINDVMQPVFGSTHPNVFAKFKGNGLIGGNTGFLYRTLHLALYNTHDEARDIIRKILAEQFIKHFHENDKVISPRTMRATKLNNEMVLTGGIDITCV